MISSKCSNSSESQRAEIIQLSFRSGSQALLEAASARPLNKSQYEEPDVYELAAAYGFGIAKAHAFVDGNKRTAFVATVTFLRLNGVAFRPDAREGVDMMEGLASGKISEEKFANWLRTGGQV